MQCGQSLTVLTELDQQDTLQSSLPFLHRLLTSQQLALRIKQRQLPLPCLKLRTALALPDQPLTTQAKLKFIRRTIEFSFALRRSL